jgi:hypothetical protein
MKYAFAYAALTVVCFLALLMLVVLAIDYTNPVSVYAMHPLLLGLVGLVVLLVMLESSAQMERSMDDQS